MCSLVAVFIEPLIQISLWRFDIPVYFIAVCHLTKILQNSLMATLTDSVRLWRFGL
jgi:hypothetical protein